MKLTGDLKAKVEAAESEQEKKAIIEQTGMLLTDDKLAEVCGGTDDFMNNVIPEGSTFAVPSVTKTVYK